MYTDIRFQYWHGKNCLCISLIFRQYFFSVTLSTIKVRYKYDTIMPLKANNHR